MNDFFSQPVFYLVQLGLMVAALYTYIYKLKQEQGSSDTPMVDLSLIPNLLGLLLIIECFIFSIIELKWWIAIPYTAVSYLIWLYIGAIIHSFLAPRPSSRFLLKQPGTYKYLLYSFFVSIAVVALFFIMAYQIFFT